MADLVQDIKSRLSVETVVGGYINLKRAGSYYKGLSPFKAEKTPSLIVTPSRQIWKDFSSGKGGDMFTFVEEIEGVDFKQALTILAAKAGLDPNDYRQVSEADQRLATRRRQMMPVLELAAEFYEQQLLRQLSQKPPGPAAVYYKRRGFNKQTCIDFRVGYAPSGRRALVDYMLTAKKIEPDLVAEAGLIKSDNGWVDQFVNRLVVPLSDHQGRVIGFTGRTINDRSRAPKYLNSPQTALYSKSEHVFGYSQAKVAIRKSGYAVIVEGNLDVLTAHQADYKMVVAAGGTAITATHFRLIKRSSADVRLAFDGDTAGVAATERAVALAASEGINLAVISLPPDTDPDELIRNDITAWKDIVQKPLPAVDWLSQQYEDQFAIETASGKRLFTDKILGLIVVLRDPVEIDAHLEKLAQKTDVRRAAIDQKHDSLKQKHQDQQKRLQALSRRRRRVRSRSPTPTVAPARATVGEISRNNIKKAVLGNPAFYQSLSVADRGRLISILTTAEAELVQVLDQYLKAKTSAAKKSSLEQIQASFKQIYNQKPQPIGLDDYQHYQQKLSQEFLVESLKQGS